jgi:hypothetical protein
MMVLTLERAATSCSTGDLAAARNAVDAGLGLPGADLLYGARYTWPMVWLGTRAEADEADRLRARHREIPERITTRCSDLPGWQRTCPPRRSSRSCWRTGYW